MLKLIQFYYSLTFLFPLFFQFSTDIMLKSIYFYCMFTLLLPFFFQFFTGSLFQSIYFLKLLLLFFLGSLFKSLVLFINAMLSLTFFSHWFHFILLLQTLDTLLKLLLTNTITVIVLLIIVSCRFFSQLLHYYGTVKVYCTVKAVDHNIMINCVTVTWWYRSGNSP